MSVDLVSAPRSGLTSISPTPNNAVLAGCMPISHSGTQELRDAPMNFHLPWGKKKLPSVERLQYTRKTTAKSTSEGTPAVGIVRRAVMGEGPAGRSWNHNIHRRGHPHRSVSAASVQPWSLNSVHNLRARSCGRLQGARWEGARSRAATTRNKHSVAIKQT